MVISVFLRNLARKCNFNALSHGFTTTLCRVLSKILWKNVLLKLDNFKLIANAIYIPSLSASASQISLPFRFDRERCQNKIGHIACAIGVLLSIRNFLSRSVFSSNCERIVNTRKIKKSNFVLIR